MKHVVLKSSRAAPGGLSRQPRGSSVRGTLVSTAPRISVWRLAALAWAGVIVWLSTESFGTGFSSSMEAGFLGLLHISMSTDTFSMLHAISRKLAHLVEYGVFCFLLYRSFGDEDRIRWKPRLAFLSILAAAAYSLTDEFHQLFVPGRGASLVDCAIDTMGAAIAMSLIYAYSRAFGCIPEDCA